MLEQRTGVYDNPYKFNAKELDRETGLYYYGARYYNPRASIWYGVDPLAVYNPAMETEFYGEGQHNGGVFYWGNLNPYIYTYQNPIKYVDPNGKQTLSWNIYGDNPQTRSQVAGEYLELSKNINMASFALADTFLTRGLGTKIMIAYASGEAAHSMQMQTHWRDKGNEAQAKKYEQEGAEATKELVVFGGVSAVGKIAKSMQSFGQILCFVKGTLIKVSGGYKKIEDIKIGDEVLSYNLQTKKTEFKKVNEVSENLSRDLMEITTHNEIILSTPEHPFYIGAKWVKASDIKPGNLLSNYKGEYIQVTSIKKVKKLNYVYNFIVEDNHNYFVTNSSILVHNGGPCDIAWKKVMNSKEVIKQLEKNGFEEVAQAGSHKKFKYPGSELYVTVADHGKKDIPKGTLSNIKKQVNSIIDDVTKKEIKK
ncbi:polymorphic toxin-type HINT domain-containing protein [Chryseobacterium sediminis]|uniref:Addiction module toxin, HicA family n=1 Tax=Chryseobacterium sediminis TaxID=1679494 RepID=A0A5B2TPY6_9FLAO|nr:addiction module toxin, HicA family [Chryseobacterium sediminis]